MGMAAGKSPFLDYFFKPLASGDNIPKRPIPKSPKPTLGSGTVGGESIEASCNPAITVVGVNWVVALGEIPVTVRVRTPLPSALTESNLAYCVPSVQLAGLFSVNPVPAAVPLIAPTAKEVL